MLLSLYSLITEFYKEGLKRIWSPTIGIIIPSMAAGISLSMVLGQVTYTIAIPGGAWMISKLLSIRKRRLFFQDLKKDLPFLALATSILVEAGSSIPQALKELTEMHPGKPSRYLLNLTLDSISIRDKNGERESIEKVSGSLEEAALFMEIAQSSAALGSGPSLRLKSYSKKLMKERNFRAEEAAQKAPVKLMLPLCLFLFPAIFILILSPVFLSIGRW
jgi:tight adherence protein C